MEMDLSCLCARGRLQLLLSYRHFISYFRSNLYQRLAYYLPSTYIAIQFITLYNNIICIDCITARLVRRRSCEKLTGTIRNAILRGGGAGDYDI